MFLAFLLAFMACSRQAFAQEQVENIAMVPAYGQAAEVREALSGMLLPEDRTFRSLNQIYEFDRTPLGDRLPVILVPGRAEEFQNNAWWKGFYDDSERNAEFKKSFKVYVFLYNSKAELDAQAQELARDLKRRFGKLPSDQPLMLVTYSLGGVIAREVLGEQDMLDRVDTQIAIAVPFHGSPMFDPDWFAEYLNPPNRSPIRRFWDRFIYRAYLWRKSNLTRGLRWDNFDSSKPQFEEDETDLAGDQAASTIPPHSEYPLADGIRAKTIIYASYLENGYTRSNQPLNPRKLPKYVLENSLALPKELVATVLPIYGFTVHSVFTYMNHQLANIATYTPEDPQGKNTHLYRFNDGAIPLSSMLFLPPRNKPYNEDFWELIGLTPTRDVRIFVNLDHMHIGEYSFIKHRLVTEDLVHADEGKRSPHEWVIYDLLKRIAVLKDPNKAKEALLEQHHHGVAGKRQVKQPAR